MDQLRKGILSQEVSGAQNPQQQRASSEGGGGRGGSRELVHLGIIHAGFPVLS